MGRNGIAHSVGCGAAHHNVNQGKEYKNYPMPEYRCFILPNSCYFITISYDMF